MFRKAIPEEHILIARFLNEQIYPQFWKVLSSEEEKIYLYPAETTETIKDAQESGNEILLYTKPDKTIESLAFFREKDKNTVYVWWFYIHPSEQRKWLWSIRLKELEQICKERGYQYILLETQRKFDWAVRFYLANRYNVLSNENLPHTYFARFYKSLAKSSIMFYKELNS